ncbi:WXG100 family type VII secretion target [Phytohabitans sp. ZYX-F-186]|uniref:WXG100 family type VII secretion target n=1 Tax=Phytohabitans maris TaxID=3071409 RepID=A0ABU0ZQR8_9ACTN|nr:WXG100 family type VII secretion target [Phytohabitans sp. ZYX-F-186]MDQ7909374.1 WXG100 family type VII secretion target [Phytohabitans sp. ZYX-F-186]
MADGTISYDYGKIAEGIDAMQQINRAIEGLVESLAQETGTALDTWTGDAADHYNATAAKIRTDFGDLNSIVHDLATEIGIRSEDMRLQDQRSGNSFGG